MAEVVDSIIANLEVRYQQYVDGFDKAAAAHARFTKSVPKIGAMGGFTQAEAQQYADRHKKVANDVVAAEEQTTTKVTRTRKTRADATKAIEASELASTKATAKAKADAEIAEAERSARLSAVAARGASRGRLPQATNSRIGATVAREGSGQSSIPAAVLGGAAVEEVAAEREINHLAADRAVLQSRISLLSGDEKRNAQQLRSELVLINQLERAGLDSAAIALRLEERRGLVARQNGRSGPGLAKQGEQFARGAGLYAATGGAAAIAGIGVAAGVYGGIKATESGIAFGKEIEVTAQQAGVTTRQIQVYQAAAREAGATNEQLAASFGRLNAYVGRAKEGDEQAAKTFKALGVDIKGAASAGDVLPTLVQRLSSIKDPAERSAVGTRLFGEEYRRLDGVLGQGTGKIDALGKSLERTGSILSERDIATLKAADATLGALKNKLEIDLARVVAGNATAILGLANAFAVLADKALKAVGAIGRIRAQNAYDDAQKNPNSADQQGNFNTLLGSAQGRQFLLHRNALAISQNEAIGKGNPDNFVRLADGRQVRNGDAVAAERARLLGVRRQIRNYQENPQPEQPVQPGSVDPNGIKNLFAPKPPKGKSADTLAQEAEARTKRYLDQLAGLQEAELRGQQGLTGDINKRADIEQDLAARALKKQLADIESERKQSVLKGADAQLEAARAAELTAAAKIASATAVAAIAQQRQADLINAANQHLQTRLSIEAEQIASEAALATTRKQRLALELRALANQTAQERASLIAQRDSLKPGDPARQDVQAKLDNLPAAAAARGQAIRQNNESPLAAYRREIHDATDDTNEALEKVKVEGLRALDDQLTSTISKVFHLGGAFGQVADQIISSLIRIGVEREIIGPLADSLFGKADGSSGGKSSFLSSIASVASSIFGHRAAGGAVVGGGSYVVGENGPELFTPSSTGKVFPNGALPALAGGGGAQQHVYNISVSADHSVTPAGFASGLAKSILDEADRRGAQRSADVIRAVPGRVQQYQTRGS